MKEFFSRRQREESLCRRCGGTMEYVGFLHTECACDSYFVAPVVRAFRGSWAVYHPEGFGAVSGTTQEEALENYWAGIHELVKELRRVRDARTEKG